MTTRQTPRSYPFGSRPDEQVVRKFSRAGHNAGRLFCPTKVREPRCVKIDTKGAEIHVLKAHAICFRAMQLNVRAASLCMAVVRQFAAGAQGSGGRIRPPWIAVKPLKSAIQRHTGIPHWSELNSHTVMKVGASFSPCMSGLLGPLLCRAAGRRFLSKGGSC